VADWDPGEHPRDKSNGEFVERTSALMVLPAAEAWAYDQWMNSEHYGTLDRHFRARDRLVEERMRQLLEPAEFRAWYSEKIRQENAREQRMQERARIERQRRIHRTYRERQNAAQRAADEVTRMVTRNGRRTRVKIQSPALTGEYRRTLTPTRMQPGRRGVFFE
jgi:hypothetical protein